MGGADFSIQARVLTTGVGGQDRDPVQDDTGRDSQVTDASGREPGRGRNDS